MSFSTCRSIYDISNDAEGLTQSINARYSETYDHWGICRIMIVHIVKHRNIQEKFSKMYLNSCTYNDAHKEIRNNACNHHH